MTQHAKETFRAGGAGGGSALAAKVRTLGPSMTRSMQRVAEAVAADPAGCARLTVTALAQLTGTSEATVVRTARILGYPGYRDLRLALAALAAQQEAGAPPRSPPTSRSTTRSPTSSPSSRTTSSRPSPTPPPAWT